MNPRTTNKKIHCLRNFSKLFIDLSRGEVTTFIIILKSGIFSIVSATRPHVDRDSYGHFGVNTALGGENREYKDAWKNRQSSSASMMNSLNLLPTNIFVCPGVSEGHQFLFILLEIWSLHVCLSLFFWLQLIQCPGIE